MAKRNKIRWSRNLFNPDNEGSKRAMKKYPGLNLTTVNEPLRELITSKRGSEDFFVGTRNLVHHLIDAREHMVRGAEAKQALAMSVYTTARNEEANTKVRKLFKASYVELDLGLKKRKMQLWASHVNNLIKHTKKVKGLEKKIDLGHAISASYAFTLGLLLAKEGTLIREIGYRVQNNIGAFAEDAKYNRAKGRLVEKPYLADLKKTYRKGKTVTKSHVQRNIRISTGSFWAVVLSGDDYTKIPQELEKTLIPLMKEDTGNLKNTTKVLAQRLSRYEGGEVSIQVPKEYDALLPAKLFDEYKVGRPGIKTTLYSMTLNALKAWATKHILYGKLDPQAYEILINLVAQGITRTKGTEIWDKEVKIIGYKENKKGKQVAIWEAFNVGG